jgi:hypothetical protein
MKRLSLLALLLLAAGAWFSGIAGNLPGSYSTFFDTESDLSNIVQAAIPFPDIAAHVILKPEASPNVAMVGAKNSVNASGIKIKAFITMFDKDVNDIVVSTVKLCLTEVDICISTTLGGPQAGNVVGDTFQVHFSAPEVSSLLFGLPPGEVTLKVKGIVGVTQGGRTFSGTDTVLVK